MKFDSASIVKALSPRVMGRALLLLDKATIVVVITCWIAAFSILFLAVYTVHSAVAAKKLAADAEVAEPILPTATTIPADPREGQLVVDRLQHQFPDIRFDESPDGSIIIRAVDGSKFHQWITAVSYVDTIDPQYRWTLRDFCVGHCGQELMKATLVGQKIMFSLPQRE